MTPLTVIVDCDEISRCPQKVKSAGLVIMDESSMDAIGRYPGFNCRAKYSLKDRQPPRGGKYSVKQCLGLASNVTSVSGVSDAGVSMKVPKATLKRIIHWDTKESSFEELGVTGLW